MVWTTFLVVVAAVVPLTTNAFVSVKRTVLPLPSNHRLIAATAAAADESSSSSLLENLADVGYQVTVKKPLGIVFGENRSPFAGLVVDDVEPGLNGGIAGIRVGDQLMFINGEYVINGDFDSVMDKLRNYDSPLELQLYRGSVSSLFTIAMNKNALIDDDNDSNDEDEQDEGIIMDENYEPPIITAEDYEDNSISVSQVASEAFKSIGGIFSGGLKSLMTASSETIQLEGDDAKSGQKDL